MISEPYRVRLPSSLLLAAGQRRRGTSGVSPRRRGTAGIRATRALAGGGTAADTPPAQMEGRVAADGARRLTAPIGPPLSRQQLPPRPPGPRPTGLPARRFARSYFSVQLEPSGSS